MTLTTHGIVGAATASFFSFSPPLAATAAFLSHFVLDAIPHWDYKIRSSKRYPQNPLKNDFQLNRNSLVDLLKIGFDFSLGLLIPLLLFSHLSPWFVSTLLLGAFFGILPDPLQFAYWKIRREPLTSLQKFHLFMHAKKKLTDRPFLGISLQLLVVLFSVFITSYFLKL